MDQNFVRNEKTWAFLFVWKGQFKTNLAGFMKAEYIWIKFANANSAVRKQIKEVGDDII